METTASPLTASGALVPGSQVDSLSNDEKFQKIDGMDMLFNSPLLSAPGASAGLNINYMDKDHAINCGQ